MTIIIWQFDVFRILIDDDNSYGIMYWELFEKKGLERGSL